MAIVFLGLGSNIGDRVNNIRKARELISASGNMEVKGVSSFFEGEAIGVTQQADYINYVVKVETDLDPHALLAETKAIEGRMGRKPDTHLMPRLIDIDILLYDDLDLESLDLMIPHSRLKSRRFVLEPLLEIDPDLIDPVSSRPLRDFIKSVESQRLTKLNISQEAANA